MTSSASTPSHTPPSPPPSPSAGWAEGRPLGRAARLGAVFAALGAAMLLGVPLCPFAIVTRHPCPGCGLTRATFALLRGRFDAALALHPLCVVIVPIVAIGIAYNTAMYVRGGRFVASESLQGKWVTRCAIALAAVTLAVWIARFFGAFGGPVPV